MAWTIWATLGVRTTPMNLLRPIALLATQTLVFSTAEHLELTTVILWIGAWAGLEELTLQRSRPTETIGIQARITPTIKWCPCRVYCRPSISKWGIISGAGVSMGAYRRFLIRTCGTQTRMKRERGVAGWSKVWTLRRSTQHSLLLMRVRGWNATTIIIRIPEKSRQHVATFSPLCLLLKY